MSLRSTLGLAEPGEEAPEQPLPIIRVCWDELFKFLRELFKRKPTRPWTALNNLEAETSTSYKTILEVEVPDAYEGGLQMITMFSTRPDNTTWWVEVTEQAQFKDKILHAALTLPYDNVPIRTGQKIKVKVKTDGTATDIVAALSGELRYLGK